MKKQFSDGDNDLQDLFDAARHEPPLMSPDFLAQLQSDALDSLPDASKVDRTQSINPYGILDVIGSWMSGLGLAGALALGLVIGVVSPQSIFSTTADAFELSDELAWFDEFTENDWVTGLEDL